MFANTEGLGLIESFEVSYKDLFVVHATIQFTINVEALEEKRGSFAVPSPFTQS